MLWPKSGINSGNLTCVIGGWPEQLQICKNMLFLSLLEPLGMNIFLLLSFSELQWKNLLEQVSMSPGWDIPMLALAALCPVASPSTLPAPPSFNHPASCGFWPPVQLESLTAVGGWGLGGRAVQVGSAGLEPMGLQVELGEGVIDPAPPWCLWGGGVLK